MSDPPDVSIPLLCESVAVFARVAWRACVSPPRGAPKPGLRRFCILCVGLPLFALGQMVHWLALWLDRTLFPSYRRTPVSRPLFIVGIPRSGTTLLHRVLARDTKQFTTFALWELLFAPSILERRILLALRKADATLGQPLSKAARWLTRRGAHGIQGVHALGLGMPEEDFLLLLPVMACYVLIAPFPDDPDIRSLARFDSDLPELRRRRIMAFYRGLVQRHIHMHGADRVYLSKNPSFTPMLRSILSTFPDGRVIAVTREPEAVAPSQISAITGATRLFGGSVDSREQLSWWLDMLHHYYKHLKDIVAENPKSRVAMVTMRDIKNDLYNVVVRLYWDLGLTLSPTFTRVLSEETDRARAYRSSHRYNAAGFGMHTEEIRQFFADVYGDGQDPRDAARPVYRELEAASLR